MGESYSYDVFGQPSSTGSVGNPYFFTGRRFDTETGLYYYRFRYYSTGIGRFLQTDPIGYYDSMNLYEYCGNDPLNWIDPWGLTWKSNWNFFWDWALGRGKRKRNYGLNTTEGQEMKNSLAAQQMREKFIRERELGKNYAEYTYSTPRAAWETILNPFTRDLSSTSAQVGGFYLATVIGNDDGTATFTIKNVAGTHSFFCHQVSDVPWGIGPMSNIEQIFQWEETIPKPSSVPSKSITGSTWGTAGSKGELK